MLTYLSFRGRNAVIVAAIIGTSPLLAHGWITSPPSRQDYCSRGELSFDCAALQWEPQSVEAPKGAVTCSGGSSFSILDSDVEWPALVSGSTIDFKWKLTAAHRTKSWLYYVDGKLVKTIDGKNLIPSTGLSHTLEDLKEGPHTILGVWNIADTPMAFYSCVDVIVDAKAPIPLPVNEETAVESELENPAPNHNHGH